LARGALHQFEIGSPDLFDIGAVLSEILLELITLRTGGKQICERGLDLCRIVPPDRTVSFDSVPGDKLQLCVVEKTRRNSTNQRSLALTRRLARIRYQMLKKRSAT